MSNNLDNRKKEMIEKMVESSAKWTAVIDMLTDKIKGDIKNVIELNADSLSYRQHVTDEINMYSVKIYRLMQKMKILKKQKFEFYATGYQIKTNSTEKAKLIEADLSEQQLLIDEMDAHVENLRETSKHLDGINYAIKNKIELSNILGGYK